MTNKLQQPDVTDTEEIEAVPGKRQVGLFHILAVFILLLASLVTLIFVQEKLNPQKQHLANRTTSVSQTKILKKLSSVDDLPDLSPDIWELVLVNASQTKEEMTPELAEVPGTGIRVDKRIAEPTANFLAAAQTVDPSVHLITGYRSVEEQNSIYETYLQQEMEARGVAREAAEPFVKAYFQAPKTSEHMTGLAIDMSTVDGLNQMNPDVAQQLATMAPDYGFVFRYKASYEPQTGMPYEDWHFRYVGQTSARYMTDYDLPLEAYLVQLKNKK